MRWQALTLPEGKVLVKETKQKNVNNNAFMRQQGKKLTQKLK